MQQSQAERERLTLEWLPFVKATAWRHSRRSFKTVRYVSPEDLEQVGAIALLKAIDRYDESRGVPLGPYLSQKINWAMRDELRKADPVSRARRKAIFEGTAERVFHYSLDQAAPRNTSPRTWERELGFENFIPDPKRWADESEHRVFIESLVNLVDFTPGEREFFRLALQDLSQVEISERMDVSAGRVSQLHRQFVDKVRKAVTPDEEKLEGLKALFYALSRKA